MRGTLFSADFSKSGEASVLWWGRFDPHYSRNRILRRLLADMGWRVLDFQPRLSALGDIEARLRGLARPDLVWVPCFRQRDLAAASRWARAHDIPAIFDPLISAYDKQVDERAKVRADSWRARRLLDWEQRLFARADHILADTPAHAAYFAETLGVDQECLSVVYVGADASMFSPTPMQLHAPGEPLEVLFYGSFIPLQGPEIVVEAARRYRGAPVKWTLLGEGPFRRRCELAAKGLKNVAFEDWQPYAALPERIRRADILLGVFGTTPKAGRVIPNKVFQSLACGRPVVTRHAAAYPKAMAEKSHTGLTWVQAGDADALARSIADLAAQPARLVQMGQDAARTSEAFFAEATLRSQLVNALSRIRTLR